MPGYGGLLNNVAREGLLNLIFDTFIRAIRIAPCTLGLFLLLLPLFDRSGSPGGTWFARDRRLVNLLFCVLFLSQVAFIIVGQWLRGKNWILELPF